MNVTVCLLCLGTKCPMGRCRSASRGMGTTDFNDIILQKVLFHRDVFALTGSQKTAASTKGGRSETRTFSEAFLWLCSTDLTWSCDLQSVKGKRQNRSQTFSVSSSRGRDSVSGEGVVELKLSSVKSMSDTSLLAARTPLHSHGRSFRPREAPSFFNPDEAPASSSFS